MLSEEYAKVTRVVITIQLLGAPAILRDGRGASPPRGRKAWALLAYLLLSERPVTRRELAELLFVDADDPPLGALRWNLAQLRRALGPAAVLQGDPVQLTLAGDVAVDVSTQTLRVGCCWRGETSRRVRRLRHGCW